MSVSGLSPRPHTASFSGTPSGRAGSPSLGSSYNSLLLDHCTIHANPQQQLFYQARKLKDTRAKEALQAKVTLD